MNRTVIGIKSFRTAQELAQAILDLDLKAPAYISCSMGAANKGGELSHLRIVERKLTDDSTVIDLEVS